MRSEKTSNDFATTEDALKEVIENYHKQGEEFELACNIYPTAPFITAKRLNKYTDSMHKELILQFHQKWCFVVYI